MSKKLLLSSLLVFSSVTSIFAAGHVATAAGTSPTCNGLCNGSAVAMASGGIGPYGFTWTGPASYTAIGANISGLCAGTYIVTAIDSSDMSTASYTLNLTQPSPISISLPPSYSACAGMCVTLSASVSGGTPSYSYSWFSPSGLSSTTISNPIACLATSTSYTLTVTDANMCISNASTSVILNATPVVTVNSPSICPAQTAFLTATGATTYSWSAGTTITGPNTATTTPSITTSYTVTGTSTLGCTGTAISTVTVNTAPVITLSPAGATCGICNGSISTSAPGATSFLWSNGSTVPNPTGLCAGTYTLTATNGMGCSSSATTSITNSSTLAAAVGSVTAPSCGMCNGSATIVVTGGSPPYSYYWSPMGTAFSTATGLCSGTYFVTITDASGCSININVTVGTGTGPITSISSTPTICGICNGSSNVSVSGGAPPYNFDWTPGSPVGDGTASVSGLCVGTYTVNVTDSIGCTVSDIVFITTTNTTSFSVADSVQNESGFGLNNGFIDLTITGSAPPYAFLWNNGATTEDIYSLAGGAYSVTITDNNGDCAMYYYSVTTPPSYGYITGYAYSDNNLNCVFDAGDSPLAGYYASVTNGSNTFYGYTNTAGYYSIYVPTGSFTVTPITNTAFLEGACTNSYSVVITAGSTIANNNFSYVIPAIYDVCVYAYSTGIVPGFNGYYNVYLNNYGTQPATGQVYLVLPGIVNYVTSSPLATSISGDTVFWNYTLIPSFFSQVYSVTFNCPTTAILGTPTIAYVNASVTNGTDINPACNSYVYTRIITGSYDPNAKTVSPSGVGVTGDIPLSETEFTYLVQFQNTGSGPAVNIKVTDTISSMLDLMSFEMLNSSHPYVVEFLPGNVIRWKFDNIMLPDSTSNEPGSHGHVQFRISKLNTPAYGEVIENKVFIYFDFNEAVITNTAINTYAMPTTIEGQANESGNITVYPNPFSDNTTFVIQSDKLNETYSFELTDVLGKKVKSKNGISEKQFEISRDGLENGIYFYKIYTPESVIAIGKVVIK